MAISQQAYDATVDAIRDRVLAYTTATFQGLGSWREADIERFLDSVIPLILGGQREIASLTDAYLADHVAAIFGGRTAHTGLSPDEMTGAALRNGVEPTEVYRRPFVDVWTALARGAAIRHAVDLGRVRLEQLLETDMQLARTHAARESLRNSPAQFFRRTLRGSKNCALCAIAATQRYRVETLMPIHTRCRCGVAPIAGTRVPHVLDKTRLNAIHEAYERLTGEKSDRSGRGEVDFRDIAVIHEHGELGPVLALRGQTFTGPGDIS